MNRAEREVERRFLQMKVLHLRKQGYSVELISGQIGKSPEYTQKLVKDALKEITSESAKQVLKLELQRLDDMMLPAYIRATDYTLPYDKDAIDAVLKIQVRRSKLLGLDMPTKTALTNPQGNKEAGSVRIYLPSNGRDAVPEPDAE